MYIYCLKQHIIYLIELLKITCTTDLVSKIRNEEFLLYILSFYF